VKLLEIDLKNKNDKKTNLSVTFSDLLDNINNTYGSVFMDELMTRIEVTINEFNTEMSSMFDQLKNREEDRQNMLKMIRSNKTTSLNKPNETVSEWEQKLETIEQSNKG